VADKLSRHCVEPPPDPRQLRPEIPAPLALLIQRMMAKRPENRFADYEELVDEIDAVPTREEPAGAPLFALIDDEEEGTDEAPAASTQAEPLFALIDDEEDDAGDEPPVTHKAGPLYALIVDEEDADDEEPSPGAGLALLDPDPANARDRGVPPTLGE